MANPYINKVVLGNETLLDLTADTVTPQTLYSGTTAHDASGQIIVGTMSGGTEAGAVTQDADGYLVLDDDPGSSSIAVGSLSVTQNGTYTAPTGTAYSPVTVNVSGGSSGGDMNDPIRFFDYDGTLVASYSSVPVSLPSVPTHNKLTNGTWNYTLQQVTAQFNAMGTCDVGANYDTVSGATEIDIVLQDGKLHPYLSLAINGTVTIDWGDNSTDTATGASLTTRKTDIHHEYATAGSYTIKITPTSGTNYSLYCTTTYTLLNKNSSTANANRVYANCVKTVRVGNACTIGDNAFYNCNSLTLVSIPSTATSIGSSVFKYCYSLVSFVIPSEVTEILDSTFYYCYSLTSISIPSGVTSIGSNAFYCCASLTSMSIPSGVTSIGGSMFYCCFSLTSISIPSGVTSIEASTFSNCYSLTSVSISSGITSIRPSAFASCYGMAEYHFEPTTPPTLANINAFSNIQSDCVIYVPEASLTAYKTANNWSTYANYMQGE